ncbi:MAG: hypothetical protein WC495_06855 [Patescibacteria group bacterium]
MKLQSIDEVLKGIMNSKPVKKTKEEQEEIEDILRQLREMGGFMEIEIPYAKKKTKEK